MVDLNKGYIDPIDDPNEPYFWQDIIKDAPICQELVANYEKIKEEVVEFVKNPSALYNYPKYTVHYDHQTYDLYAHYWKASPMSIFEKEYIDGGANPFQLQILYDVIKNNKKKCPTINKVVFPLDAETIKQRDNMMQEEHEMTCRIESMQSENICLPKKNDITRFLDADEL